MDRCDAGANPRIARLPPALPPSPHLMTVSGARWRPQRPGLTIPRVRLAEGYLP